MRWLQAMRKARPSARVLAQGSPRANSQARTSPTVRAFAGSTTCSPLPSASRTLAKYLRLISISIHQFTEGDEAHQVARRDRIAWRVVDQPVAPYRRGQHAGALVREQVQATLPVQFGAQ